MGGVPGQGPASRRAAGKRTDTPAPKPGPQRKTLILYAVALLVVVLVFALKNVDGGPEGVATGPVQSQMALVSWNLSATDATAGAPLFACGSDRDCDPAELEAAAERNAACTLEATYWLVSNRLPIVSFGVSGQAALRSLEIDVAAVKDNGTGVAFQDDNQSISWHNGAWWKAESEHVTVTADVLCDLDTFAATFDLEGRAWFGESWRSRQAHTLVVQQPELPQG